MSFNRQSYPHIAWLAMLSDTLESLGIFNKYPKASLLSQKPQVRVCLVSGGRRDTEKDHMMTLVVELEPVWPSLPSIAFR
jgi:hypothetical protein